MDIRIHNPTHVIGERVFARLDDTDENVQWLTLDFQHSHGESTITIHGTADELEAFAAAINEAMASKREAA